MAYIPEGARWYLADIILEHRIEDDPDSVVHVNIHLIEAGSPEEAYRKAVDLGRRGEIDYLNTDGKEVRTSFRGLRDLNVIHDELEDGAELIYEEVVGLAEEDLARWIKPKDSLGVFAPRIAKTEGPNYLPGSVMEKLKQMGHEPEEDMAP